MGTEMIETVLGPIPAEDLGRTQMHEHLLLDIYPSRWGFSHILDDIGIAVEEMKNFKAAGGGAVVEVTGRGAGQNPRGLQQISQEAGIHIVMGTGFLWGQYSSGAGAVIMRKSVNEMAEIMIRDLTVGVGDTGIKSGLIGEIGCGANRKSSGQNYISPEEERLLRAAARAHRATGAAIYTDTFHGELVFDQIAILEDEGVHMERVVIGHLGDRRESETYKRVAATGANLGFDHVGMQNYAPDEWRVTTIKELVAHGLENHIVLSMDVHRRDYWHCMGGIGYDYLLRQFIPMLTAAELSERDIEIMLVENPSRILQFSN